MNFKRSERVGELLRHEISNYIQHISNPKLGFVTVVAVRLSDDLSDAKIFYSVYGSEEEKAESGRILNSAIFDLRHDLGKRLESLRRIPHLQFVLDDTAEKAQRVGLLLHQLAEERTDPNPEAGPPAKMKKLDDKPASKTTIKKTFKKTFKK